jgi:hypothetical protein
MKKNKLILKSLVFLMPAAFICSATQAQNDSKQSAVVSTAKPKASATIKEKYEANGLQWNENSSKASAAPAPTSLKDKNAPSASSKVSKNPLSSTGLKTNSAARPCVNKVAKGPGILTKATFNNLSPKTQEFIKNHPEKYTIVDQKN